MARIEVSGGKINAALVHPFGLDYRSFVGQATHLSGGLGRVFSLIELMLPRSSGSIVIFAKRQIQAQIQRLWKQRPGVNLTLLSHERLCLPPCSARSLHSSKAGVLAVFDPVGTAYQGTIEGEHPLLLSPVPRGLEKGNRQTKKKSPHAGVEVPEGLFKCNFGDR